MPAAAARAGGLSATQGAVIPRQGREGGANEARRVVTRLCACRNALPVDLAQRRAQLLVEPRKARKEAPAKPAASPRANGLTATWRAASRRTAPDREGGASEVRRVATRQWSYRNAARSFSSNRALLEVRRR